MNILRLVVGMAASCSLSCGCIYENQDDCPGKFYARIYVQNHWDYAPDASPDGMAYFFFPDGGGDAWRFDLPGRDGGEIKLPNGPYRFLTFNDDTSTLTFLDEDDYGSMRVTTLPTQLTGGADITKQPQPEGVEGQEVLMCPDELWCYAGGSVNVELRKDPVVVPAYPRSMVCNYHFDITDVVNLQGVARMSGAISGMARWATLSSGERSAEAAIHPVPAHRQGKDAIHGDFLTFGRATAPGMKNYLFLMVRLTNGKQYMYKFDVTEQAVNAPDPTDVWLRIEGLKLPDSESGEGGAFEVTVDGWTTIDIHL